MDPGIWQGSYVGITFLCFNSPSPSLIIEHILGRRREVKNQTNKKSQ